MNMPGAFPTEDSSAKTPFDEGSRKEAMKVVDEENHQGFSDNQNRGLTTQKQLHLINQLDTLVYFLVGYQMIKYCHSASIVPVVFHMLIQKILSSESIINGTTTTEFIGYFNESERHLREHDQDSEGFITSFMRRLCSAVYWKGCITMVYHICLIWFWMLPIARHNDVKVLNHGTWWFVSFIGESTPTERFNDMNWVHQVWDLGLPGLIFTDMIILFVQLVLYQAIYKQSTMSPYGRKHRGNEVEVLRANGELGHGDKEYEPPLVFRVRLYEVLRLDFVREGV